VYAEQRIEFERELAMVSTRATDGTQRYFPLVVSRQETGVCREVYGPAVEFGISPRLEERSREIMAAMGQDVDFCGTFAVEFFLDPDGKLLVNEMAPRVHNTGHYSLFGQEPSQFDLHVQAVTGAPLSEPRVEGLVVMRNLLGPAGGNRSCSAPTEEPPSGTGLWWYGKGTARPGRKMGHLTGRSDSQEGIEALRDTLRQYESRFWSNTMEKGAQQ
jgi:5-(carboxyamino)imidazole ribonucleotide synthase